MALNVKVALMICMTCIGAVSWVARQVEAPGVAVPSPLVSDAQPVNFARTSSAVVVDWRADLARQLEYANAVERQAQENRSADRPLAVAGPAVAPASNVALAELPPLVGEQPTEAPPAFADQGGAGPATVLAAYVEPQYGQPPAGGTTVSKRYRVSRGDTLHGIARREWQSDDRRLVELLKSVNPQLAQRSGGRILVGEELLIPGADEARRWLASVGSVDTPAGSPGGTAGWQWYTIQPKDTLASIAQRFLNDGRRWREIVELNGQLNPRKIVPGTRIKLPVALRVARS